MKDKLYSGNRVAGQMFIDLLEILFFVLGKKIVEGEIEVDITLCRFARIVCMKLTLCVRDVEIELAKESIFQLGFSKSNCWGLAGFYTRFNFVLGDVYCFNFTQDATGAEDGFQIGSPIGKPWNEVNVRATKPFQILIRMGLVENIKHLFPTTPRLSPRQVWRYLVFQRLPSSGIKALKITLPSSINLSDVV